jgi:hypothetical protein
LDVYEFLKQSVPFSLFVMTLITKNGKPCKERILTQ